jgi:hypothetical protein
MSVYVGIDVHRKRSQLAVIDAKGEVLANRNVPNGAEPILGGDRRAAAGDAGGVRGGVRHRVAGGGCWRATAPARTWCTRRGARRSHPRG